MSRKSLGVNRGVNMVTAAGNLSQLQKLLDSGERVDELTMATAVAHGQLEIMDYLHRLDPNLLSSHLFQLAIKFGDLDILRWLHASGCQPDEKTFRVATKYGKLEIMKWLKSINCPWNQKTFEAASKLGDAEILQWLRNPSWIGQDGTMQSGSPCPKDSEALLHAIKRGDVGEVRCLLQEGCRWDEDGRFFRMASCKGYYYRFFRMAAHGGHLEIMKLLHSYEFPWDEDTYAEARSTVKPWLAENGCPVYFRDADNCWNRFWDRIYPYLPHF